MLGPRPARTGLLVALYGLSGLFSLLNAAFPMDPDGPVELGLATGVIGVVGAAVLWWRGARLTEPEIHSALTIGASLVGLLAAGAQRPVGVVSLGPVIIAMCIYAGWFLPPWPARLQAAVILVIASAGALLTDAGALRAVPGGFLVPWLLVVFTAGVLTEIQCRLAEQLRHAASTDPLTGLLNRRAWESEASRLLAHADRSGEPLTVAILDLDAFKAVNDQLGHSAGDALLRDVSSRWSGVLRRSDVLGRYGGDEFVLCLPGTDADGAAEMLGRLVASHDFSWSAGSATARSGEKLDEILGRADAELYRHKRGADRSSELG